MKNSSDSVNSWTQLSLERPAVVTLTMRIGIVYGTDHVQAQLEVRDESLGVLLAMQSWPALDAHGFDEQYREVGREFTKLLLDALSPFAEQ